MEKRYPVGRREPVYAGFVLLFALLGMIIAPLLLLTGCGSDGTAYTADVANLTGLDITGSTVISSQDSHGGFLGDGELTVVYDCSKVREAVEQQMEQEWNELPLTENLELIMYGGARNGASYVYNLAEKNNIPEITNGYYYFINRQYKGEEAHDDTFLFYSASFNFSLFLYDSDTSRLYYYEFDT